MKHFALCKDRIRRLRGVLGIFLSLLPVLCILGGYRLFFFSGQEQPSLAAPADAAEHFPVPDALEQALLSRYAASLQAQDSTVSLRVLSAACAVQCNRAKAENLSLCSALLSLHFPLLCEPDALCERAARDALLGYDPSGGALAFARGDAAPADARITAVFSDYFFFSPQSAVQPSPGEKSS